MSLRLDEWASQRGYRLETMPSIGSTNEAGLEKAEAGHRGPLWLVADEQTGGRGRRGRGWASPPGNLYASLLLIDPAPMARLAELGFVAGVAIASAIGALGLPAGAMSIKWPNDLVSGGAKFTGLLLETRQTRDRLAVVVGFGVNCISHPGNLAYPTTDLSAIAGRTILPEDVFAPLSRCMADELAVWDRGAGFDRVRESWLRFAGGLGRRIRVETGTRSLEGRFEGIDAGGRLLLQGAAGLVAIEAGDVFLEAAANEGAAKGPRMET